RFVFDEKALKRTAEHALFSPEPALGKADAVRLRIRHGVEAHPLTGRIRVQIEREIRIDEYVAVDARERPADTVSEIRSCRHAAYRRRRFAGDKRHAKADPVDRGSRPVEPAFDEAMIDGVRVKCEEVAVTPRRRRVVAGRWPRRRLERGETSFRKRDVCPPDA